MGTLINAIAIIIASLIGLLFKSKLNIHITQQLKLVMGLVLMLMGIGWFVRDFITYDGTTFQTQHELLILLSIIIGTLIGSLLQLDERFRRFIKNIETN